MKPPGAFLFRRDGRVRGHHTDDPQLTCHGQANARVARRRQQTLVQHTVRGLLEGYKPQMAQDNRPLSARNRTLGAQGVHLRITIVSSRKNRDGLGLKRQRQRYRIPSVRNSSFGLRQAAVALVSAVTLVAAPARADVLEKTA